VVPSHRLVDSHVCICVVQSAHGGLPSLASLVAAALRALAWLREHYWEPQVRVGAGGAV
jgi:hypothetical protein